MLFVAVFFAHSGILLLHAAPPTNTTLNSPETRHSQSYLSPQSKNSDAVIGVLSDIHMNEKLMRVALKHLKEIGATHIITMGDISSSDPSHIRQMYGLISPLTGIPKDQIFIVGGNHEYKRFPDRKKTREAWQKTAEELSNFGRVVTKDLISYGYVEIDGTKIAVSHAPLNKEKAHEVFLPRRETNLYTDEHHLQRAYEFSYIGESPDPNDLALQIVGHTHISGIADSRYGYPILNAGTLLENEAFEPSFALFKPGEESIEIFKFSEGQPYSALRYRYISNNVPRLGDRTSKGRILPCPAALQDR